MGPEFVNSLETVTFTYKNDPAKRLHDGLIARDVKMTLDKLKLTFSRKAALPAPGSRSFFLHAAKHEEMLLPFIIFLEPYRS